MAFSFPEIKGFQGLYLQRNSFDLPDGYMETAENAIVSRDNILSKRRGLYQFYNPNSGVLNKIFNFQEKLLAAYTDKVVYYTETGTDPNKVGVETVLTGETVSITSPRVARTVQGNNNLYFTTDNGPLKLTSYNSRVSFSGAPPGLDCSANFIIGSQSTFLGAGNIVGYRVVFGYTDANGNLILGAPSDIATITNTLVENVTGARSGAGPYTITVTSTAHGLTTGQYLNFTLHTGSAFHSDATGVYQITVIDANTFSYSVANNPGAGSGTLDYSYAMPVSVEFSIPTGISTALPWFYQIYRSSQQAADVGIFSDFKLLNQFDLTPAQLAAEVAFFTDDYEDVLLGAELYTNENSREGELQANFQPPLCEDVTLFKGFGVYANCTTKQILSLAVVDSAALSSGDFVEFKIDTTSSRYVARTGAANQTLRGTCTSSSGLLITYASHGFSDGDTVYISTVTGGTLAVGTYYVVSSAANTFKISTSSGGSAVSFNGETSLIFQGVTNGTYPIFYLSQSASSAVRLRDTAEGLVKAINRNTTGLLYARYTSGLTDIPGKIRLQAKGFGPAIYARASSAGAGQAFSPILPDSFSAGSQVFSVNDFNPNALFISKFSELEAVPLVNFLLVGSKNKVIKRVHALRDSMIVLKEDGVWRVTGDNLNNFTATLLDGTVFIVAPSSSDVLNNQVVFLSNQGICLVTESSVQIISRTIEDLIQPILGQPGLSLVTSGFSYETERLYIMTTSKPSDQSASVVYVYNFLTNGWSSWDTLFAQGVIGPMDRLYLIDLNNNINRERKEQTKIDYTGQNYAVSISEVASDKLSCVITMLSGGFPEYGDIVVKENIINRQSLKPVFVSGDSYRLFFSQQINLLNGDTVFLYKRIVTTVKFAPFHAGLVGKMKHYSEVQLHLRESSVSKLNLTFAGDNYSTSEEVNWVAIPTYLGWGNFPWGFEPWGETEIIQLTQGTRPAPIVRTYVPLLQARNTFLQTQLVHSEAGEPMNIQSLSFAVRPYGGRVSR